MQDKFVHPPFRVEPPKEPLPIVRVPIRVKITLPYLLLAVLIAAGAAYLVTRIVFDTVQERYTNQLIETGRLAAEYMVEEEARQLGTLRLLSHTAGMAEAVTATDPERLRDLIYPVVVNAQEDAVEVLDGQGVVLFSMRHRPGGGVEEYDFPPVGQPIFAGWPVVERVIAREVDPLGDKFAGLLRADGGDYFYVSGPILDEQGELAGVLLVGKALPALARGIREDTLAQVTIYDLAGSPLATTFMTPQPISEEESREVANQQGQASYVRDLAVQNIDYSEILATWEARAGQDLGLIGVSLPEAFIVRASQATRAQIFLIGSLAFLLTILLGVNLANFVTRPLSGLVKASGEVSQGNLGVQVPLIGHDEFTVLAQSFNNMVFSLDRSQRALLESYDSTLEGWSRALELRDQATNGHTRRVTAMTLSLAQVMGIPDTELVYVRWGALLHDIGKMGIPDEILLKTGPLTDGETAIMQRHPEYARDMLRPVRYLRPAIDIPYCHHEKWDGSGYPRGLMGEQIPLAARIFAVVDVWDALRSDRPYRSAWPAEKALDYLLVNSGSHFDPAVVKEFIRVILGSDPRTARLAGSAEKRSGELTAGD